MGSYKKKNYLLLQVSLGGQHMRMTNNLRKIIKQYLNFLVLLAKYSSPSDKQLRKLTGELLCIAIRNNGVLPSLFFIVGHYSEEDIKQVFKELAISNVKWIVASDPPHLPKHTGIKLSQNAKLW